MPDPLHRRHFLAAGAALAAGSAATAAEPAAAETVEPIRLPEWQQPTERKTPGPLNPDPPDARVGFALVGLGRLTLDELMPAFGTCRYAKPTALVTGDAEKGRRVARQYGLNPKSVYSYKEFDRIRDDAGVQVVYIVLPNSMHHEFTLRSAAAGKHVLCEKPMANSVKECEEMIAACHSANRKLMIAYRLQYEPHHRKVIAMARSGQLGALKFITADNGQNEIKDENWRHKKALAGGGSLPDIGIYCLNFARYVTGEEPAELFASTYSTPNDVRFKEVEENVAFQLRFPSGVIASCTTGYGHHSLKSCRVVGELGWAAMDPGFTYRGLKLETSRADGKALLKTGIDLPAPNQFAAEMDHMAQCVRSDIRPHTPGEEGLQDQRVIEALYRSAETARPVKLEAPAGRDAFRGPAPKAG